MKPSEIIIKYLNTEFLSLLSEIIERNYESLEQQIVEEFKRTDRMIMSQHEIQNKLIRQIRDLVEDIK